MIYQQESGKYSKLLKGTTNMWIKMHFIFSNFQQISSTNSYILLARQQDRNGTITNKVLSFPTGTQSLGQVITMEISLKYLSTAYYEPGILKTLHILASASTIQYVL